MFQKLEDVEKRYEFLTEQISDPNVIADNEVWRKYMKEHADITDLVNKYREYKQVKQSIEDAKEMLNDPDLGELAQMELNEGKERIPEIEEELKILLLPKDPNDDKNVIIEIRGGAGGDEAALFAHDLFRMYTRFAEKNRWSVEMMSSNETDIGGFREVVFMVKGNGAYSKMKYESGVHRVQRVPDTESSGRIHTSTVTVAVLPELEAVDTNIEIKPEDIRIDTFRSSGAGGQHVNKTESAIRITHFPTGIVVECQSERSQTQNKESAMKMLISKLYDKQVQEQNAKLSQDRKNQVGSGDRSEKIRTYNFPQGRITDHRINLSVYQMEAFLNGDIDEMVDSLNAQDMALKLKSGE